MEARKQVIVFKPSSKHIRNDDLILALSSSFVGKQLSPYFVIRKGFVFTVKLSLHTGVNTDIQSWSLVTAIFAPGKSFGSRNMK